MRRSRIPRRRGVPGTSTAGEVIGLVLVVAVFTTLIVAWGGTWILKWMLIVILTLAGPTAVAAAVAAGARAIRRRRGADSDEVTGADLPLPLPLPLPAEDPGTSGPAADHARPTANAAKDGPATTAPADDVAEAPRPDGTWHQTRSRFHRLRAAYAAYECDPMEVLRLPALADVTVGSTARFVDAFAEAQALETDLCPAAEHAASFVTAVQRAERAWTAAREAAERIRLSGLSPAERATVERVIKLLMTARRSDSAPERLAAYAMARSQLLKLDADGVIHLPRQAAGVLEVAARGALPA